MKKPFKMKGNPMQRNFGIGSPVKDKPTKKELVAAANDPSHPNSIKNMGERAYYAWKAGGKSKTTYHGAGGKIMNKDGTVNEKATKANIKQPKK